MNNTHYFFKDYAVDIEKKIIEKNGTILSRDNKHAQLTYLLCQYWPNSVNKEIIMKEIWPGQIVTEASVFRLISDLRQTLGDSGKDQSLIKTDWGKGFRMTCSVSSAQAESLAHENNRLFFNNMIASSKIFYAISFALISIAAGIFALKATEQENTSPKATTLAILPVNVLTGDESDDWISLGISSMITAYFQDYSSIKTISLKQIMNEASHIELRTFNQAATQFQNFCHRLGCTHLLYLEYRATSDGNSLGYSLISKTSRPDLYQVSYIDVSSASEHIALHVSDVILPRYESRKSYNEFYSRDSMANRSFAIASNDRLRGNLKDAESYYLLTLEKDSDFFWAKWGLATLYYKNSEWEKANILLEELENHRQLNAKRLGAIFHTKSSIEAALGNFEQARKYSFKAISLYKESNNEKGISNIKHNIGMWAFEEGNISEALFYLKDSMELDLQNGNKTDIAISSYNLARVYIALNQYQKARDLLNQAMENALSTKMVLLTTIVRRELAHLKLRSGITTQQLTNELDIIESEFKNLDFLQGQLETQLHRIELRSKKGHLLEAMETVKTYLESLNKKRFPYLVHHARYLYADLYYRQNQYTQALDQLDLLEGAWRITNADQSLLRAKILYAKGSRKEAISEAEKQKMILDKAWTDEHQKIFDSIRNDLLIVDRSQ